MSGGDHSFLTDLHVHTSRFSFDSGLKPEDAIARAMAIGLDAICFTEHNACWPAELARELSERAEFPVLRGMEVSTEVGHVLVFGLEVHTFEMSRVEELRHIVDSEGGVMVLAHPTREPGWARPWQGAQGLFEGLETMNADDSLHAMRVVQHLADELGLAATGGSDAHSAAAVGRGATAFASPVRDEAGLVAAIRERATRPVILDHHHHHPRPGGRDAPPARIQRA